MLKHDETQMWMISKPSLEIEKQRLLRENECEKTMEKWLTETFRKVEDLSDAQNVPDQVQLIL